MGDFTPPEHPKNPPWTEVPLPQWREHTQKFLVKGKKVDYGDVTGEYLTAGKIVMTEKHIGKIGVCNTASAVKVDMQFIDWLISSNLGQGDQSGGEVVGAYEVSGNTGIGILLAVRMPSVPRFFRSTDYLGDEKIPELYFIGLSETPVAGNLDLVFIRQETGKPKKIRKVTEYSGPDGRPETIEFFHDANTWGKDDVVVGETVAQLLPSESRTDPAIIPLTGSNFMRTGMGEYGTLGESLEPGRQRFNLQILESPFDANQVQAFRNERLTTFRPLLKHLRTTKFPFDHQPEF